MTSVEATKTFIDRENDMKERHPGEIFEVTSERAKYLAFLGFVKIIDNKPKKTKSNKIT